MNRIDQALIQRQQAKRKTTFIQQTNWAESSDCNETGNSHGCDKLRQRSPAAKKAHLIPQAFDFTHEVEDELDGRHV